MQRYNYSILPQAAKEGNVDSLGFTAKGDLPAKYHDETTHDYTHTRTHARTHARTYVRMHVYTLPCTHSHAPPRDPEFESDESSEMFQFQRCVCE